MCCGTLSLVEEQTNMVMWTMFAAPLEIAADVRHMPNASAAILLNKEVIRVNQDPLVKQGRRVSNLNGESSTHHYGCSCCLRNVSTVWPNDGSILTK